MRTSMTKQILRQNFFPIYKLINSFLRLFTSLVYFREDHFLSVILMYKWQPRVRICKKQFAQSAKLPPQGSKFLPCQRIRISVQCRKPVSTTTNQGKNPLDWVHIIWADHRFLVQKGCFDTIGSFFKMLTEMVKFDSTAQQAVDRAKSSSDHEWVHNFENGSHSRLGYQRYCWNVVSLLVKIFRIICHIDGQYSYLEVLVYVVAFFSLIPKFR